MFSCYVTYRKMRKPDPEPGTSASTRKRLSVSAKPLVTAAADTFRSPSRSSSEAAPPTKKRSLASTNSQAQTMPADDPEPRSSFETGPAPPKRNQTQPQEIKSRPAPDSPPLQCRLVPLLVLRLHLSARFHRLMHMLYHPCDFLLVSHNDRQTQEVAAVCRS
jgi:hypothetical protein